MTKYDISILGSVQSVIALSADDTPPTAYEGGTVYTLPLPRSDVCIGVSEMPDWRLAFLLDFFYRAVLGYPKCTLEVNAEGRTLEVEICDTPSHLARINLPKCKLLSTIMHRMPDLTEHTVHTVYSSGIYRIIPICCRECFRTSVLSELRLISGLPNALAGVGLSDGAVVLSDSVSVTPSLIAAAAVCHPDFSIGGVTLTALDVGYTVVDCGSFTSVYTPAALINKTVF